MSFRSRRGVVALLALLGIVFAVAVTWAASQIVSQRIGLSSEPVSAGLRLLPARRRAGEATRTSTTRTTTPTFTVTTTTPSAAPPSTEPQPPRNSAGEGGSEADRARAGDD